MGYRNEILKSLNADHHTIYKFDGNQSSDYISVRNALKTFDDRRLLDRYVGCCLTCKWAKARNMLALGFQPFLFRHQLSLSLIF